VSTLPALARFTILALVALFAIGSATTGGALAAGPRDEGAIAATEAALAPADWTAIQTAISDQLAALRSGDASRAFAFASDGIRAQFNDAPTFLRMVQASYAALLAARYTQFLEGAVIDGRTIQPLRHIQGDDTVLVALNEMQRDERGTWRIAACVLAPSTVRST
jgi:hypothetical protein